MVQQGDSFKSWSKRAQLCTLVWPPCCRAGPAVRQDGSSCVPAWTKSRLLTVWCQVTCWMTVQPRCRKRNPTEVRLHTPTERVTFAAGPALTAPPGGWQSVAAFRSASSCSIVMMIHHCTHHALRALFPAHWRPQDGPWSFCRLQAALMCRRPSVARSLLRR